MSSNQPQRFLCEELLVVGAVPTSCWQYVCFGRIIEVSHRVTGGVGSTLVCWCTMVPVVHLTGRSVRARTNGRSLSDADATLANPFFVLVRAPVVGANVTG